MRPRSFRTRLAATFAVVGLGLAPAACTSDPAPADPEEALVQTVEDTLDQPFAYRLVAEADRDALEALGRDLGSVVARLNLFEVTGVVADGSLSVDVRVVAEEPLLQLRRFGQDELYVRIAAGDGPLAAVATPELEGRLLGVAVQTGQPDTVVAAIGALFDGDWVGLSGEFDPGALARVGGTEEATAPSAAQPTTPLPEVLAEYLTVTDRTDEEGTTTTRVDLRVRALLRSLASLGGGVDAATFEEGLQALPATVTGDVVTSNGRVEAVVFDVAAAAREAGDEVPGSLQLRLELSEHGAPEVPEVPEARVTVPSADLADGLAQMLLTPPPAQPEPAASGRP